MIIMIIMCAGMGNLKGACAVSELLKARERFTIDILLGAGEPDSCIEVENKNQVGTIIRKGLGWSTLSIQIVLEKADGY